MKRNALFDGLTTNIKKLEEKKSTLKERRKWYSERMGNQVTERDKKIMEYRLAIVDATLLRIAQRVKLSKKYIALKEAKEKLKEQGREQDKSKIKFIGEKIKDMRDDLSRSNDAYSRRIKTLKDALKQAKKMPKEDQKDASGEDEDDDEDEY